MGEVPDTGDDGATGVAIPPPPRTRKGAATRERILVAASELFARRGYTGTSVEAIASAASITVAGMYRHFTSKEQLLLAVAHRVTRISTARRGLGRSGDLAVEVGALFAEYLAEGEEIRRRLSIEMSRTAGLGSTVGDGLADYNRTLRRALERTIVDHSADPALGLTVDIGTSEVELLAHLILILLMGAIHLDTLDPERVGDPDLIAHLTGVTRRLLVAEGPTSPTRPVRAIASVRGATAPSAEEAGGDGRRLRGVRTRRRILAAAAELFALDGYDITTTDRIAERAGITVPGLYRHFPSKGELLVEVGRATFDGYRLIGSLGDGTEVAANLAELAVAFSSTDDRISRRLTIELDFGAWRTTELAAALRGFHRRVRRNVAGSLAGSEEPDGTAERAALVYLMLFMGIAHLDTVDPELVGDAAWADLLRRRVPQILAI